ncbi:IL1R2 protein, partial [Polyodon spathula]|nr:IL1R2 protein [Polyodon spathula]
MGKQWYQFLGFPTRNVTAHHPFFRNYLRTDDYSDRLPQDHQPSKTSQSLVIPCQAVPGFPDDFTIIYWLVNSTFIKTTYPSKRIQENQEKIYTVGGKTVLQRDLKFNWTKKKDFNSNFTCVVMNPSGMDKMQVTIGGGPQSGCLKSWGFGPGKFVNPCSIAVVLKLRAAAHRPEGPIGGFRYPSSITEKTQKQLSICTPHIPFPQTRKEKDYFCTESALKFKHGDPTCAVDPCVNN